MCQRCLDAVKLHWPDLPESQYGTLLWSCTCFPFGLADDVERQVKQMAEQSGRDLSRAILIADAEITAEMAKLNQDVPRGAADIGGHE